MWTPTQNPTSHSSDFSTRQDLARFISPEMRAAWKDGRKELFYPHDKTYAQTLGEQD
jgi:hypothetical protein